MYNSMDNNMSGKRYQNVSIVEYQEIWRNQKSLEEETACGFFDKFRRDPGDKKDDPLKPGEDDKEKKAAASDKDKYPPIVTIDGRVDTDIDHLIEDLADEYKGPVDEIPSKFPKPHVFSVIEGSLDDDVDSYANDDGTMEHTLVDAPKNFNPKDLKDVASNDVPRNPGHSKSGQLEASHTDRSHNKMSADNDNGQDVPVRENSGGYLQTNRSKEHLKPGRLDPRRSTDHPFAADEKMQQEGGHDPLSRHVARTHTADGHTRKKRNVEDDLMPKSSSCLDHKRGHAVLHLMKSESADGHSNVYRYHTADTEALNPRTGTMPQCDSSTHTTEAKDCSSFKDIRPKDSESAVCLHAYTESLTCTITDESFRDGHASLDVSALRADPDQSLSDTESASDTQMTSSRQRARPALMYENYDYNMDTKVGPDFEHRLYHFPSYSDDSLTKSSELYPRSRYMTHSTSHLSSSQVQNGYRQTRPNSDPTNFSVSMKSSHSSSQHEAGSGRHSESCPHRAETTGAVDDSFGTHITLMPGSQAECAHTAYPQTTPILTAYPQTTPIITAYSQTTPVYTAYPQTTSVNTAYPQTTPVHTAYPQTTPVHTTYPQTTSVHTTYHQDPPIQTAYLEDTPVHTAYLEETPVHTAYPDDTPVHIQNVRHSSSKGRHRCDNGTLLTDEPGQPSMEQMQPGSLYHREARAKEMTSYEQRKSQQRLLEESHVRCRELESQLACLDLREEFDKSKCQRSQPHSVAVGTPKEYRSMCTQNEIMYDESFSLSRDLGIQVTIESCERNEDGTNREMIQPQKSSADDRPPRNARTNDTATADKPRKLYIQAERLTGDLSDSESLDSEANYLLHQLQMAQMTKRKANSLLKHVQSILEQNEKVGDKQITIRREAGESKFANTTEQERGKRGASGYHTQQTLHVERTPSTSNMFVARPGDRRNMVRDTEVNKSPEADHIAPGSSHVEAGDRGLVQTLVNTWDKHHRAVCQEKAATRSSAAPRSQTRAASTKRWSTRETCEHKEIPDHVNKPDCQPNRTPATCEHHPPTSQLKIPTERATEKRNVSQDSKMAEKRARGHSFERSHRSQKHVKADHIPGFTAAPTNAVHDSTSPASISLDSLCDNNQPPGRHQESTRYAQEDVADKRGASLPRKLRHKRRSSPDAYSCKDALKSKWKFDVDVKRIKARSSSIKDSLRAACQVAEESMTAAARVAEALSIVMKASLISPPSSSSVEDKYTSRDENKSPLARSRRVDSTTGRSKTKPTVTHARSPDEASPCSEHETSARHKVRKLDRISEKSEKKKRSSHSHSTSHERSFSHKTSLSSPLRRDTFSRKPRQGRASNHELDTKSQAPESMEAHSKSSVTLTEYSPRAWGDSTGVSKDVPDQTQLVNDQQIIVQVAYTNSPECTPPGQQAVDSKTQVKQLFTLDIFPKDDQSCATQDTLVSFDSGEMQDRWKTGQEGDFVTEDALSKPRCIDKKHGDDSPVGSECEVSSKLTVSREEWTIPNSYCSSARKIDSYFTQKPPVIDQNLQSISLSAKQIIRRQLVGSCVDPGCADSAASDSLESNSNFNRSTAGKQLHMSLAHKIEQQQRQRRLNTFIMSKCREEMELSQMADPVIIWQCDASLEYEAECYPSDTNVFLQPDRGKRRYQHDSPQPAYRCISRSHEESNMSRSFHIQDTLGTSYQLHEEEILQIEDYFESSCTNPDLGPFVATLCYTDLSSPVSSCFNLQDYGALSPGPPDHSDTPPPAQVDMSQQVVFDRKYPAQQPRPDDQQLASEGGDTPSSCRPSHGHTTPAPKPRARKLQQSDSDGFPLPGRTAQITKFSPIFEELCPEEVAYSNLGTYQMCPDVKERPQNSNNNNNSNNNSEINEVAVCKSVSSAPTRTTRPAPAASSDQVAAAVVTSRGNTSRSTRAQPSRRGLCGSDELSLAASLERLTWPPVSGSARERDECVWNVHHCLNDVWGHPPPLWIPADLWEKLAPARLGGHAGMERQAGPGMLGYSGSTDVLVEEANTCSQTESDTGDRQMQQQLAVAVETVVASHLTAALTQSPSRGSAAHLVNRNSNNIVDMRLVADRGERDGAEDNSDADVSTHEPVPNEDLSLVVGQHHDVSVSSASSDVAALDRASSDMASRSRSRENTNVNMNNERGAGNDSNSSDQQGSSHGRVRTPGRHAARPLVVDYGQPDDVEEAIEGVFNVDMAFIHGIIVEQVGQNPAAQHAGQNPAAQQAGQNPAIQQAGQTPPVQQAAVVLPGVPGPTIYVDTALPAPEIEHVSDSEEPSTASMSAQTPGQQSVAVGVSDARPHSATSHPALGHTAVADPSSYNSALGTPPGTSVLDHAADNFLGSGKSDVAAAMLEDNRVQVESADMMSGNDRVQVESVEMMSEDNRDLVESVEMMSEDNRDLVESVEMMSEDSRVLVESVEIMSEDNRVQVGSVEMMSEDNRVQVGSVELMCEDNRVQVESVELMSEDNRVQVESVEMMSEDNRVQVESVEMMSEDNRVQVESVEMMSEDNRVQVESVELMSEDNRLQLESAEDSHPVPGTGSTGVYTTDVSETCREVPGYTNDDTTAESLETTSLPLDEVTYWLPGNTDDPAQEIHRFNIASTGVAEATSWEGDKPDSAHTKLPEDDSDKPRTSSKTDTSPDSSYDDIQDEQEMLALAEKDFTVLPSRDAASPVMVPEERTQGDADDLLEQVIKGKVDQTLGPNSVPHEGVDQLYSGDNLHCLDASSEGTDLGNMESLGCVTSNPGDDPDEDVSPGQATPVNIRTEEGSVEEWIGGTGENVLDMCCNVSENSCHSDTGSPVRSTLVVTSCTRRQLPTSGSALARSSDQARTTQSNTRDSNLDSLATDDLIDHSQWANLPDSLGHVRHAQLSAALGQAVDAGVDSISLASEHTDKQSQMEEDCALPTCVQCLGSLPHSDDSNLSPADLSTSDLPARPCARTGEPLQKADWSAAARGTVSQCQLPETADTLTKQDTNCQMLANTSDGHHTDMAVVFSEATCEIGTGITSAPTSHPDTSEILSQNHANARVDTNINMSHSPTQILGGRKGMLSPREYGSISTNSMISPRENGSTSSKGMISPREHGGTSSKGMLSQREDGSTSYNGMLSPREHGGTSYKGMLSPREYGYTISKGIISPREYGSTSYKGIISPRVYRNTSSKDMISPRENGSISYKGIISPREYGSTSSKGIISPREYGSTSSKGIISPRENGSTNSKGIISPRENGSTTSTVLSAASIPASNNTVRLTPWETACRDGPVSARLASPGSVNPAGLPVEDGSGRQIPGSNSPVHRVTESDPSLRQTHNCPPLMLSLQDTGNSDMLPTSNYTSQQVSSSDTRQEVFSLESNINKVSSEADGGGGSPAIPLSADHRTFTGMNEEPSATFHCLSPTENHGRPAQLSPLDAQRLNTMMSPPPMKFHSAIKTTSLGGTQSSKHILSPANVQSTVDTLHPAEVAQSTVDTLHPAEEAQSTVQTISSSIPAGGGSCQGSSQPSTYESTDQGQPPAQDFGGNPNLPLSLDESKRMEQITWSCIPAHVVTKLSCANLQTEVHSKHDRAGLRENEDKDCACSPVATGSGSNQTSCPVDECADKVLISKHLDGETDDSTPTQASPDAFSSGTSHISCSYLSDVEMSCDAKNSLAVANCRTANYDQSETVGQTEDVRVIRSLSNCHGEVHDDINVVQDSHADSNLETTCGSDTSLAGVVGGSSQSRTDLRTQSPCDQRLDSSLGLRDSLTDLIVQTVELQNPTLGQSQVMDGPVCDQQKEINESVAGDDHQVAVDKQIGKIETCLPCGSELMDNGLPGGSELMDPGQNDGSEIDLHLQDGSEEMDPIMNDHSEVMDPGLNDPSEVMDPGLSGGSEMDLRLCDGSEEMDLRLHDGSETIDLRLHSGCEKVQVDHTASQRADQLAVARDVFSPWETDDDCRMSDVDSQLGDAQDECDEEEESHVSMSLSRHTSADNRSAAEVVRNSDNVNIRSPCENEVMHPWTEIGRVQIAHSPVTDLDPNVAFQGGRGQAVEERHWPADEEPTHVQEDIHNVDLDNDRDESDPCCEIPSGVEDMSGNTDTERNRSAKVDVIPADVVGGDGAASETKLMLEADKRAASPGLSPRPPEFVKSGPGAGDTTAQAGLSPRPPEFVKSGPGAGDTTAQAGLSPRPPEFVKSGPGAGDTTAQAGLSPRPPEFVKSGPGAGDTTAQAGLSPRPPEFVKSGPGAGDTTTQDICSPRQLEGDMNTEERKSPEEKHAERLFENNLQYHLDVVTRNNMADVQTSSGWREDCVRQGSNSCLSLSQHQLNGFPDGRNEIHGHVPCLAGQQAHSEHSIGQATSTHPVCDIATTSPVSDTLNKMEPVTDARSGQAKELGSEQGGRNLGMAGNHLDESRSVSNITSTRSHDSNTELQCSGGSQLPPSKSSLALKYETLDLAPSVAKAIMGPNRSHSERMPKQEKNPDAQVILDATDKWLSRTTHICKSTDFLTHTSSNQQLHSLAAHCKSEILALSQSSHVPDSGDFPSRSSTPSRRLRRGHGLGASSQPQHNPDMADRTNSRQDTSSSEHPTACQKIFTPRPPSSGCRKTISGFRQRSARLQATVSIPQTPSAAVHGVGVVTAVPPSCKVDLSRITETVCVESNPSPTVSQTQACMDTSDLVSHPFSENISSDTSHLVNHPFSENINGDTSNSTTNFPSSLANEETKNAVDEGTNLTLDHDAGREREEDAEKTGSTCQKSEMLESRTGSYGSKLFKRRFLRCNRRQKADPEADVAQSSWPVDKPQDAVENRPLSECRTPYTSAVQTPATTSFECISDETEGEGSITPALSSSMACSGPRTQTSRRDCPKVRPSLQLKHSAPRNTNTARNNEVSVGRHPKTATAARPPALPTAATIKTTHEKCATTTSITTTTKTKTTHGKRIKIRPPPAATTYTRDRCPTGKPPPATTSAPGKSLALALATTPSEDAAAGQDSATKQITRARMEPLTVKSISKTKSNKQVMTMQEFERIQQDRHLSQAFHRINSSKACVDSHLDGRYLDTHGRSVRRQRERVNYNCLIALENIKFLEMLRFKKSVYRRDGQLQDFQKNYQKMMELGKHTDQWQEVRLLDCGLHDKTRPDSGRCPFKFSPGHA